MRDAVIVSTPRTGSGRAFKGSMKHSMSPSMLGHEITQVVFRAGFDGAGVAHIISLKGFICRVDL
jgi:hypothetical protein